MAEEGVKTMPLFQIPQSALQPQLLVMVQIHPNWKKIEDTRRSLLIRRSSNLRYL